MSRTVKDLKHVNPYSKELPDVRRTQARHTRRAARITLRITSDFDGMVDPRPRKTQGWVSH